VESLAERLAQTRSIISEECSRLGRIEPTLIVVTKNHSVDLAKALFDLGERDFGENRVQEAAPKAEAFEALEFDDSPRLHLIGQLQTNKVKQALEFATTIHSLDRESLLQELVKRTVTRQVPLGVFIQVNLTNDENRGGIQPEAVLAFANEVANTKTLNLLGLMAVASVDVEPASDFERVASLSQSLVREHPSATELSIGMSNDYVEALHFGATHLRIGTAITGNRQY
jgi:pyridoxal phosphate enzyme (YggS family)